jgi:hypothetical protein
MGRVAGLIKVEQDARERHAIRVILNLWHIERHSFEPHSLDAVPIRRIHAKAFGLGENALAGLGALSVSQP